MGFSVARIYFLIVIGVNLYAYYLYNQIGNVYGKSNDKCEHFSEYGYKVCVMISNTLMIISNVIVSKKIVDFMDATRKCYENNAYAQWDTHYKPESIGEGLCKILAFAYGSNPILIIVSNLVFGVSPCFHKSFPSLYYHHILITCMLSIIWFANIYLLHCASTETFELQDAGRYYYKTSELYKNIHLGYKIVFTVGFVVLHGVGLYFASIENDYLANTQNYILTIFWTGFGLDVLNLFVLFYDNCADLVMDVLTTLVVINDLIVGICLIQTHVYLTLETVLMLVFSNIFVGIWVIYFIIVVWIGIVFLLKYTIICLGWLFIFVSIMTVPLVFALVLYMLIKLLMVFNFFCGLELNERDDGKFFDILSNNSYKMLIKQSGDFANELFGSYVKFIEQPTLCLFRPLKRTTETGTGDEQGVGRKVCTNVV